MKKAFTLAEVLITLTIIGVVAAMTIPTLISNYQKKQYVVGLQRNMSVIQNGIKLMLADEQVDTVMQSSFYTMDIANSGTASGFGDVMFPAYDTLSKYMKIVDRCYGETEDACPIYKNQYKMLDDTIEMGSLVGMPYFILNDGTIIFSYLVAADNFTHILYVDVNGEKGPNQFGRDFYFFYLKNNGGLWYGQEPTSPGGPIDDWREHPEMCGSPNSTDLTGAEGTGCVIRIIEEGWKMTY